MGCDVVLICMPRLHFNSHLGIPQLQISRMLSIALCVALCCADLHPQRSQQLHSGTPLHRNARSDHQQHDNVVAHDVQRGRRVTRSQERGRLRQQAHEAQDTDILSE